MQEKRPLLVFTFGGGRLGNQLVSYGHLIAFLAEHPAAFDFVNSAFWVYDDLFEHVAGTRCTLPTEHTRLRALRRCWNVARRMRLRQDPRTLQKDVALTLHAYAHRARRAQSIVAGDLFNWKRLKADKRPPLDLADPDTVALLQQKPLTMLGGWGVRSWALFDRHQETIRQTLAIHTRFMSIAEAFVADLRQRYDFLIGVLIRQTDYRRAKGGVHFFETPQYVQWMHEAADVFADRGRVGFVVASDEEQDPALFQGVGAHFSTGIKGGPGHYMESLAELSLCDLVMSPISTFSAWAAFAGDSPFLQLQSSDQHIQASDALPNHIVDLHREDA